MCVTSVEGSSALVINVINTHIFWPSHSTSGNLSYRYVCISAKGPRSQLFVAVHLQWEEIRGNANVHQDVSLRTRGSLCDEILCNKKKERERKLCPHTQDIVEGRRARYRTVRTVQCGPFCVGRVFTVCFLLHIFCWSNHVSVLTIQKRKLKMAVHTLKHYVQKPVTWALTNLKMS